MPVPASQVPLHAPRTPRWYIAWASRQGRYLELTTALAASAKKEKCWTTNFPLSQRSLSNLTFSLFAVFVHPPQSSTVARACCAFLAGRGQSFFTCLTLHCVLTFFPFSRLPTRSSRLFFHGCSFCSPRLLKPCFEWLYPPVTTSIALISRRPSTLRAGWGLRLPLLVFILSTFTTSHCERPGDRFSVDSRCLHPANASCLEPADPSPS